MSESDLDKLTVDGTVYPTRLTDKYRRRRPTALPDPAEIRAAVPGAVLAVSAEPGRSVRRGQPLLVLEAMKMENAVLAPRNATVGQVHVAPGDPVTRGDLLVTLDPD